VANWVDIKNMSTDRCLGYSSNVFAARNQAIKFSESDLLDMIGLYRKGAEKPFEIYKKGIMIAPKIAKKEIVHGKR
jgi:hypothetical protein